MNKLQKKYKKMAIESANRERLLLMFYEEAINCVKRSLMALEKNQIEERCKNIGKAYNIILELNNTLDHKIGQQIALDLESLYVFMMKSLIQANIRCHKEGLENVLKILETLYDGWSQAVKKIKQEKDIRQNNSPSSLSSKPQN